MKVFPAEWHAQKMVLIAWPNEKTDWVENLTEVIQCYKKIAHNISKFQSLTILGDDIQKVKSDLGELLNDNIKIIEVGFNDTWIRDYGPISIFKEGSHVLLDFQFNGWGKKFEASKDNQVNQLLGNRLFTDLKLEDHLDFVLEGGSIETDGKGTLLTTSHCLMAGNRNQPMSHREIEKRLKDTLGVSNVLWLEFGWLDGDDTDGHIDTLARFCSEDTIAYVKTDDVNDSHYYDLQDMENELKSFTNAEGKSYNLIPLPLPDPVYSPEGNRLPATYANFLIINEAVLMPLYNCKQDDTALQQLTSAFPDREVIGINCLPLIRQNGSLHCMTMQIPQLN